MKKYRESLLSAALEAREREVAEYQVNIDNFDAAIKKIGDCSEMQDFKNQLSALLTTNIFEQKKAALMLEVTREQLSLLQSRISAEVEGQLC